MPDVSAISLRMRRGPLAVGLQTFFNAKAFNANIGAWNTAAVTNLSDVSAVPAVARNADADARAWMWVGFRCDSVVCAATPPV